MSDESFSIDANNTKKFKARDPYNPQNEIEGVMCMAMSSHYGSMWITKVNDKEVLQYIHSAPKFGYAYDNNDAFILKADRIDSIIAYDKLDGSCIIQYRYQDADGHVFQSFKTRGMPFLSEDFKWMWDKVVVKYPFINDMLLANDTFNVCYELYGMLNKHGLLYDVDIDTAVLFGRMADGEILPPCKLVVQDVPTPKVFEAWDADGGFNFEEKYIKMIEWLDSEYVPLDDTGNVVSTNDQGYAYKGYEGSVWYVNWKAGGWKQFKCKATPVCERHRKCAAGIGTMNIQHAIYRALEDGKEINFDNIYEELKTDYPEQDVQRAKYRIIKGINRFKAEKFVREEVAKFYNEQNTLDSTFDLNTDKNKVMRAVAKKFEELGIDKRHCTLAYVELKRKFGNQNS